MNIYSVIFSPTGRTQQVADIVTKELSQDFITIDLTLQNTDFSKYQLQQDDIAIIAMPSFGGRAPQIALEKLKQIKAYNARAILVCTYGNRAYEDTLVEMQDTVESIGFNVICAISAVTEHSIVRLYGANRPDTKDKDQLKEFAQKIKERIASKENIKIEIPGNRPYKKSANVALIPQTTKTCTNCKKCAEFCPTEAISKTNVKLIDKKKCISCMRCVSICQNKAKKINKIMTGIISLVLKNVCTDRKGNELF